MKTGIKSILWSAAALLLLLAVAVPLVNALVAAVMMVPAVILYTTLSKRSFAVHMAVVYAIGTVVLGPAALIIGVFFLIPSVVMGHLYRKGVPARKVLTAVMLTLLGESLLELLLADLWFDFSLIHEIRSMITDTIDNLNSEGLMPGTWTAEVTESYIQSLIHAIPMALIVISFVFTVIAHAIAGKALRASGLSIPKLQPAHKWMLPRFFVLYYLIVLMMDMAVPTEGTSFMTVMLHNLLPLMKLAFSIQAMGFCFYLAHERKWNKAIPVILSVIVAIFPPLSLVGVLDAAFPIRRAFKKS
ncbi:DUF2232 domain-containing protein [Paenibacillus sacheonensis]|uniref:DUF2232 domain-containing protein n=1 Tax=Paenibacillus sacheonensis TaxID=742054 RepID=UPI0014785D41|nr:DUF2232 domain-containing protein [Paenibacillus sacheonensis]MBM7567916.1 uncharacterized protein YybS (DUF2232 family) [Paenibacillus sacheonensis]